VSDTVLEVEGLRVELRDRLPIVSEISFAVSRGEIVGLVGESGSGKTTTGLALLGYTRPGARIVGGNVVVDGTNLLQLSEAERRHLRGKVISYVAQDPSSALNPGFRIRVQMDEILRAHAAGRVNELLGPKLESVRLPTTTEFESRYPHQLSGGQQQRLAIAIALACNPAIAILDEPTTGLDVVTQAHILSELSRIRRETGIAMVYVTHNLAVVGEIADRVIVMYGGRIVESGSAATVLRAPRHPYTRGLVASTPDHLVPRRLKGMPGAAVDVRHRPPGCPFAPRCAQRVARCDQAMPTQEAAGPSHFVSCYEWRSTPALTLGAEIAPTKPRGEPPLLSVEHLEAGHRTADGVVVAASDVSFGIASGESVALVGESGSGKTTIARCISGLHPFSKGRIALDGEPLANRARRRSRTARRRIQIIFQNPHDSLNPRHAVGDAIERPLRRLRKLSRKEAVEETGRLLEAVRLSAALRASYPRELSGGERQRVAIARALAAAPDLLVCDEITSALDVSVQAAVLDLLAELRKEFSLALLFISHDLGVVAALADRTLVLDRGTVIEQGATGDLLRAPTAAYTKELLAAAPRLDVFTAASTGQSTDHPEKT
jgi:peptide/nickel transport system ATP-binding protein